MKLLTKNTDYAVRALLVLSSDPGKYISARDVADEQRMPYQFTRKILNQLINSGYVISRDGAGGGFRLIEDPDSIKLVELIGIFQGRIQLSECMFRNKLCHNRDTCVLRENIKRIERIIEDEFREITIGSLLDQMRKKNER